MSLTATEALRNAGYGHHAGENPYASHTVFELSTGRVVTQLRAHEVWEFLKSRNPKGGDNMSAEKLTPVELALKDLATQRDDLLRAMEAIVRARQPAEMPRELHGAISLGAAVAAKIRACM